MALRAQSQKILIILLFLGCLIVPHRGNNIRSALAAGGQCPRGGGRGLTSSSTPPYPWLPAPRAAPNKRPPRFRSALPSTPLCPLPVPRRYHPLPGTCGVGLLVTGVLLQHNCSVFCRVLLLVLHHPPCHCRWCRLPAAAWGKLPHSAGATAVAEAPAANQRGFERSHQPSACAAATAAAAAATAACCTESAPQHL
jgi:hypothetical protein